MTTILIIDESQFGSEKDPALQKLEPDKKFYLAYDDYSVENPHYHNDKFYPIEAMVMMNKGTKTQQICQIKSYSSNQMHSLICNDFAMSLFVSEKTKRRGLFEGSPYSKTYTFIRRVQQTKRKMKQ